MAAILDTALLQALLFTGQSFAALELLKGPNYCDIKICEEILQENNHYSALLELYKCNSMHREALKILHQLVEESKANKSQPEPIQMFKPEMIIDYLKVSFHNHLKKTLTFDGIFSVKCTIFSLGNYSGWI